MFVRTFFPLIFLSLFLTACTSHTYDDVQEDQEELPPPPVLVTYQDVKPIFENSCVQCHGTPPTNGATNSLTNYDQVSGAVQNRGLINLISQPEGANGLMPPGGPRLPQSAIDLIRQWEDDGLLEE